METDIQRIVNKNKLNISRIPSWAREAFVERSKEEFSDDYGMCLAAMIKECGEYIRLKQMFFDNDLNVSLLFNPPAQDTSETSIKMANGKTIKCNGGIK